MKRKRESGLTSIELIAALVVFSVLAVIFVPQIPKFFNYVETTEAVEQAGHIAKALREYQDARGLSPANTVTALGTNLVLERGGTVNQITDIIPDLALPGDAAFKYTISLGVNTMVDKKIAFCILATGTGSNTGTVLFSRTPETTAADWEVHTSRINYVTDGGIAHSAGGNCSEMGAFSAN